MDERPEEPSDDQTELGDGPYRTTTLESPKPKRKWIPWAIGGALALAALIAAILSLSEEERQRPSFASVPTDLFGEVTEWPPPEAELPPATPLAPLLVADQPDSLAVLSPGEGARSLRRGQSLSVRFNRPMVRGALVGRPAETSPLRFEPPLAGVTRWTSRSQVMFQPASTSWTSGVREHRLHFVDGLSSTSGELLADDRERVFVLDGAPRVITYRSSGRVNAGAPLPMYFDAPVNPATLASQLLAYEIGGGQRSLGVSFAAAPNQPDDAYRVDIRLRRALEPGARIGLALAPRYLPYAGNNPAVMTYELAPRPHIEGLACSAGAAYAGQCTYRSSPGRVIEIGPTLRLLSSSRLSGLSPANISIRPALRDMRLRLAPHGPPAQRLIEISGEWDPDQAYEVRVQGLTTEDREPVRPLAPIAVRSSGHSPEIRVATGSLTYEAEATAVLMFATINPTASDVIYRPVAVGEELRALVSPGPFVRHGGLSSPLGPLAPEARANRWGAGRFSWRGDGRSSRMAVVAFRPDAAGAPTSSQIAFVQATDLGVTVRANAGGLLVWVTSLESGAPVSGAEVSLADSDARERGEATTDRNGVARLTTQGNPLVVSHVLRVTSGSDRAVMMLDPRRAVGPASMGLTPGSAPETDDVAIIATVFTDRGAYRPGEGMHAKITLRSVEGAEVSAVTSGSYIARLFNPSAMAPVHEETFQPSSFGTADFDVDLPAVAPLGSWRIEVTPADDDDDNLGTARLQVARFRQPSFRVDVGSIPGPVHAGDQIEVDASGTYLFGAPVTNGELSWSLVRSGGAPMPEQWSEYRFAPIGASAGSGTVASGEEELGESGSIHVEAQVQLAGTVRTRFALEAEVTDSAGHTQAGRRSFTAYPAAVEVGIRRGDDWVELGEELDIEAIAIEHDGTPIIGQTIEARVVREGWHSWWEWSEASHSYEGGGYQLRRDRRTEVVHRCRVTSEVEAVHCVHAPTRSGTYRLEVEASDEAGRSSTASRRVYVAGPDEHPDRDPPGAPIEVTPTRAQWTVGSTAELAFESPWEEAQALITVEREGIFTVERRQVGAGGQIIQVPVTAEMVPNVFIGVTLVRPRIGPPGETADINAPDLRFGMAELRVRPATSALEVSLELETTARPGTDVEVTVQVRDENGNPVRGEVVLWAVDEGTLRMTNYQVPEAMRGLFRSHPAAFAWDDLRRSLVSRVAAPPMPQASGDGGEGQVDSSLVDDRERFDPTPLWAPRLETDEEGRATATITLPPRPTEYRVMAVALDTGARSGRASAQLSAEQPVVLRPAFPSFVTAGDTFDATAFVHNATDESLSIRVWATVGGERQPGHTITVPAGGERRVAETLTAPPEGPLEIRFDARSGEDETAVRDEVNVMPRGRFVRSQVFGAADHEQELPIGLPESTPSVGHASVTVASHPFIGFEGAIESLESSGWGGVESTASTLLALAAYADLEIADATYGFSPDEINARGETFTRRLLRLQNSGGGFERWSSRGYTLPLETTVATHALQEASRHGWLDDEAGLGRARDALAQLVRGAAFIDYYGEWGLDRLAYALRVLAEAEMQNDPRATELHDQMERLSPYGAAQLAMALGEDDSRTDTLVLTASRLVLMDPENTNVAEPAALRWVERSARVYGAVLEAASRFDVGHDRTGDLAGHLLAIRGGRMGHPWGSAIETAQALKAMSAYAQLYDWESGEQARVYLDGEPLRASVGTRSGAFYPIAIPRLRGSHTLRIVGPDDRPVFYTIDGAWAVAIGEPDTVARGRATAVHRLYETADGRRLEDGAMVPLGAMIRVRLFVYTEGSTPELVALHDRIPAGFDAVDAGHDSTPMASLRALLGTGPDDGAVDARAHHAMRSMGSISHREFADHRATYVFDRMPGGLQEYTYAIRATTVGEFTVPPAQIAALHDLDFVARSRMNTLRVVAEMPTPEASVEGDVEGEDVEGAEGEEE